MHSPRDKRKPLRSRSTEGLLLDAKIRVVLLQLFQRWSRLDSGPNVGVPALVHALDIVDVKVDIAMCLRAIALILFVILI